MSTMPPSRAHAERGGAERSTPGVPRTQSLRRAVAVLRAVAQAGGGARTSEIAAAAELPRATAARLLATLADAGLVERPQGEDGWILGYEAVRLGRSADPYGVLIRRGQAPLEALSARTGESSVLAVTRGALDIEIIAQVDAPNLLRATNWLGRRFALHASVSGKLAFARLPAGECAALLAPLALERLTEHTITDPAALGAEIALVRARGYAQSVDELEIGLAMVGVDVPGGGARGAVASVGVMGPSGRIVPRREAILAAVRDTAAVLAQIDW